MGFPYSHGGTPNLIIWMIRENLNLEFDDFGGIPPFQETTKWYFALSKGRSVLDTHLPLKVLGVLDVKDPLLAPYWSAW